MSLPKDPVILLSFINTKLRDTGMKLSEFCDVFEEDETSIQETLSAIHYEYDPQRNQFL